MLAATYESMPSNAWSKFSLPKLSAAMFESRSGPDVALKANVASVNATYKALRMEAVNVTRHVAQQTWYGRLLRVCRGTVASP